MAHLVDKEFVERANTVLLLGILWTGLAVCVVGALVYDIAYWLQAWGGTRISASPTGLSLRSLLASIPHRPRPSSRASCIQQRFRGRPAGKLEKRTRLGGI